LLLKLGVAQEQLDDVRTLWQEHGTRTMFLSKLSYGVSAAFLVVAGMVEMSFRKFLKYATVVAVAQYGTLFFLGYYFGSAFGSLYGIFNNIQYVVAAISLFAIGYYIFRKRMRDRLLRNQL
jgi:membrane protein DedA with SNARE-associated domain